MARSWGSEGVSTAMEMVTESERERERESERQ